MEQHLRPNAQRARNAIALLWVMLVMEVLMLAVNYRYLGLMQRMQGGEVLDESTVTSGEAFLGVVALLYVAAFVFAAITFIQWFRRAYFNLHLLTPLLQHGEGWAAGAWFVPVLNLFRPYQIMRDMYEVTNVRVGTAGRTTAHVGWWWAFWVISLCLERISSRLDMRADDLGEMILSTQFGMAAALMGIPAALFAVAVVKRYAAMEPVLATMPTLASQQIGEVKGA